VDAMTGNGWRIILGVVAGGIGLPQALQDDAHCLQDVTRRALVPGDPRDGRHSKIHQNLGDIPRQDRQSSGLGDMVHLDILEELLELDELHQLFMVIPGFGSPGLRLHQRRLTQA
jgi:hypothetical protein